MATSIVKYLGNLRTECTHVQSGTEIITDAPVDNKGRGEAFSPTDLVATAYALGVALHQESYDLALNVGIAGSFYRNIKLGQLVEVREDILSELGAEDDEEFLSLDELELGEVEFNATDKYQIKQQLRKVTAITVNTVHGNEDSISLIRERVNPTIETMEGAAFFYACEEANIPGLQVRAISNYVEKRNKENWNLALAVKNLNDWLVHDLKNF